MRVLEHLPLFAFSSPSFFFVYILCVAVLGEFEELFIRAYFMFVFVHPSEKKNVENKET